MSRQSGLRQRSLRGTCRMGRATELVFVLATGAALMLGGAAQAQVQPTTVTYTGDSAGSVGGSPIILIVPNAGDTFTQSGAVVVTTRGILSITKEGAGTLILTSTDNRSGLSNGNGTTFVNQGTLVMNGGVSPNATFNVTVANGATLAGNGSITDLTVNSGGTIAPGALARGSIGTLTTNNVTLNAGSVLLIEVDATSADRINAVNNVLTNANGAVVLNSATLRVADTAGDPTLGQVHTIISSTGGVVGTFGTVMDDYAFFDAAVTYEANAVKLVMASNIVTPVSGPEQAPVAGAETLPGFGAQAQAVAQTDNQRAAAKGLAELPASGDLIAAILPLTNAQAQAAFDNLSGEVHADVQGRAVQGAGTIGNAALDHLGQIAGGGAGGGDGPSFSTRGAADSGNGPRYWGGVLASASQQTRSDGFARARADTAGLIAGMDLAGDGAWTFGGLVGVGTTRTRMSDRLSDAETVNSALGLYGGRHFGSIGLGFGLLRDVARTKSNRVAQVGSLSQTLSSSYTTGTTLAFAEISGTLPAGFANLTPFLRLSQAQTRSGSFTETGGSAALTRGAQTNRATLAKLGLRGAADITVAGMAATLTGGISYQSVIAGGFGISNHGFAAGGSAFDVGSGLDQADVASIDMGLTLHLTAAADLQFSYSGARAGDVDHQQLGASLSIRF